jgi:hypothetical protein
MGDRILGEAMEVENAEEEGADSIVGLWFSI